MRVLYISDRAGGGIVIYLKCLAASLQSEIERYVIGICGDVASGGRSVHNFVKVIGYSAMQRLNMGTKLFMANSGGKMAERIVAAFVQLLQKSKVV